MADPTLTPPEMEQPLGVRGVIAEAMGTLLLLATVVGSRILL